MTRNYYKTAIDVLIFPKSAEEMHKIYVYKILVNTNKLPSKQFTDLYSHQYPTGVLILLPVHWHGCNRSFYVFTFESSIGEKSHFCLLCISFIVSKVKHHFVFKMLRENKFGYFSPLICLMSIWLLLDQPEELRGKKGEISPSPTKAPIQWMLANLSLTETEHLHFWPASFRHSYFQCVTMITSFCYSITVAMLPTLVGFRV